MKSLNGRRGLLADPPSSGLDSGPFESGPKSRSMTEKFPLPTDFR